MSDNTPRPLVTWFVLASRLILFGLFQALIALILFLAGMPNAWHESVRWWMFSVSATNVVSIVLLVVLLKREGRRYLDLLSFSRATLWQDLALAVGGLALAGPIAMIPMITLGDLLLGSYDVAVGIMFRPIPTWAIVAGLFFPLSIAFAELPTYFGYLMPRLERQLGSGWWVWFLSALFLGLQHATLPLVMDSRFILWRALMYLPFALYLGLIIKWRPRLLPYLMIGHGLIDIGTVAVYLVPR